MTDEARLEQTPTGLVPTDRGWFVLNVADAAWVSHPALGAVCPFEHWRGPAQPEFGLRVWVLQPGQPMSYYHAEQAQEGFLVLAGECLLVIEGRERALRTWDYVHCPPGTEHALVGAGDGPAAVLAVGTRKDPEVFRYPVNAVAARHGASAATTTSEPAEAYAGLGDWDLGRPAGWERLPWA
jgi:uncharacterized cupin superfamily protein